jgi:hypothetical protein
VDVPAAAAWMKVPASTIRGWIMRYRIRSHGPPRRRRKQYSLSDLIDAEHRATHPREQTSE